MAVAIAPDEQEGAKRQAGTAALIWPLVKTQLPWIIVGLLIGAVSVGITAGTASALARFVDKGIVDRTLPAGPLLRRLLLFVVLGHFQFFAVRQIYSRILFDLEFRLRLWLYERLQAMDPRKLDAVASGQMITRAQTDLHHMQSFVVIIPELIYQSIFLLGFGFWLMLKNPLMTLVAMAAIPANLYFVNRLRKRLWGLSWLALNKRAEVTTQFDEAVRGIRVVKAHGREELERERLADVAGQTYGVNMSRVRLLAKFDMAIRGIPLLLSGAMLFLAGRFIVAEVLTVGTFLVFLRYGRNFSGFAQALDNYVDRWQYAKTSAGRLVELMGGSVGVISRDYDGRPVEAHGLPEATTGLELDEVSISYNGQSALDALDVRVGPGELVVVCGGPRSGKSAIAALACGRQGADSGRVLLDGHDVGGLDQTALRREVRWLTEEPFMFGRTVRENLEMGAESAARSGASPAPGDEALRAALYAAAADTVVDELPAGLDEVLGERGMTVSGGQRQRLALARAMVAPPRVLVLDDALLAVNPSLELEILRRLRVHAPRMAILCLTRRESLVAIADRVLRLTDRGGGARANGDAVAERDAPYDPRLSGIIGALPATSERPRLTDEVATRSDEPPAVLNLLGPFRAKVAQAGGLVLALTVATLVPGLAYRQALDAVEKGSFSTSDRLALVIMGLAFGVAVLNYATRVARKTVEEGVMYLLRRRMFQRVTRLGVDYYDRELPGYVSARVVNDLDKVSDFLDDGPYIVISSMALLAATFGVILAWNASIALTAAVFIPVVFLVSLGQLPVANRMFAWQRRELGEVVARLQEDFTGRYVINSYGIERWARSHFVRRSRQLRRSQKWSTVTTNLYSESVALLLEVAATAVLWRSGNLVVAGLLTTGTLVSVRLYTETALAPIPRLAGVLQTYLVARASFRTLRQPFQSRILPDERAVVVGCPPLSGRITFDGVTFVYPGTSRPVLHHVELDIAPGQVVALVGPTGAGKSSITKLITRIYDPDEGAVLVDGVDLRELDLASYRRRVGVVLQDSFCFRGTVAGNIAYGRPEAAREQIEQAAAAVGAHDVLSAVPGGFDGLVEEEGRNLTAAQRQMIGLTRAWLAAPDCLVLDEATSTLDADLEQRVLEAVRRLGRTTVFVTHRLSVARQADLVVLVDQGKLVQSGTHKKLVGTKGAYADLWATGPEVGDGALAGAKAGAARARRRRA